MTINPEQEQSAAPKVGLIWIPSGNDGEHAKAFGVPGYDGLLPFLVPGEQVGGIGRRGLEFSEAQLLPGVFFALSRYPVGAATPPPEAGAPRTPDRSMLLDLLRRIQAARAVSVEELVFVAAGYAYREYGAEVTKTLLEAAASVVTRPSPIKSDLILLLWELAIESSQPAAYLQHILDLVPQVDMDEMKPAARQAVAYIGLCATVLLGRNNDVQPFMEKYVQPNVEAPELRQKTEALMRNPKGFTPRDLKIDGF